MIKEFEMKEETVFIKDKILPGSTVEDTCTVYVQGDHMKLESKQQSTDNSLKHLII